MKYMEANMAGWIADRSWFFHSCTLVSNRKDGAALVLDGTHPSDPHSTVLTKYHLPCWLERLEELVWLEECFDAQCVQDPECDEEEQDILRSRSFGDARKSLSRGGLGLICRGVFAIDLCRSLRQR